MLRKKRIAKLLNKLKPAYLLVEDESHQHHVPQNAETHFKVVLVSEHFKNLSRIERHRQINNLLATELSSGLHALSLHLFTPSEWETWQAAVADTPRCLNGFRHG